MATTTRRARISKSTRALIEQLRDVQSGNYWGTPRHSAEWREGYLTGLRRAVEISLIYETPWSLNAINVYIDKQLAEPTA